jgi:hypothetical protein
MDHQWQNTGGGTLVSAVDSLLDPWIARLRDRLARGDPPDLPQRYRDEWGRHLSSEHVIRIMLHDLDELEAQRAASDANWRAHRHYHYLLEDFQRLRELLG